MPKNENTKYVKMNGEGDTKRVSVDFGNMSKEEADKILAQDEGLRLVYDLDKSSKMFLYEAKPIVELENSSAYYLASDNNMIVNASRGGLDANNEHTAIPKTGYDGQVGIHPQALYTTLDKKENTINVPRANVVFHELAENYERTHNNVNYNGENGAHKLAITRENKWDRKSVNPGSADLKYFDKERFRIYKQDVQDSKKEKH